MSYLARVPYAGVHPGNEIQRYRRRCGPSRHLRWRSQTNAFQEVSNNHFQGDDGMTMAWGMGDLAHLHTMETVPPTAPPGHPPGTVRGTFRGSLTSSHS